MFWKRTLKYRTMKHKLSDAVGDSSLICFSLCLSIFATCHGCSEGRKGKALCSLLVDLSSKIWELLIRVII